MESSRVEDMTATANEAKVEVVEEKMERKVVWSAIVRKGAVSGDDEEQVGGVGVGKEEEGGSSEEVRGGDAAAGSNAGTSTSTTTSVQSSSVVVESAAPTNTATSSATTSSSKTASGATDNDTTKKPVWNVQQHVVKGEDGDMVAVPDGTTTVSWPSLVDSKEPLPKKKQREQAAAAAVAEMKKDDGVKNQSQNGKGKQQNAGQQGKRSGEKKGRSGEVGGDHGGKKGGKGRRGGKGGISSKEAGDAGEGGKNNVPGGNKVGKRHTGGKRHGYGGKGVGMGGAYGGAMAPIMYAPATPVFYPPAAYGITSNVESVMIALRNQIEYYFSEENLAKDMFLRKKMDANGWVDMETIAAFNRVRMLTPDLTIISSALATSSVVELTVDGLFLRAKNGSEKWVLPASERDPNIQSPPPVTESQTTTKTAESMPSASASRGGKERGHGTTTTTKSGKSSREEDDVFQLDEEHEEEHVTLEKRTMTDAQISKLIVVKPSTTRKKSALSSQLESSRQGDDVHSTINAGLEVYGQELRKSDAGKSKAVSTPRPVANGRKHGKNHNVQANFYPASVGQSFTGRPKSIGKGSHRPSVAVGWVLGSTPDTHGGIMSPTSRRSGSYLGSSVPIQKFQHPSYELLEENGFTEMKYEKFHDRCIAERAEKGVGLSEEMNTLFRFWCYFLRDHFNQAMYDDFKKYASDDSEQGYHYGIECLFRFFSYGLESHFNEALYKEFEEYVLRDHNAGHLYGLEKFWAYHHYHGLPKDCGVEMNSELSKLLETDFKTIDDFKARRGPHH